MNASVWMQLFSIKGVNQRINAFLGREDRKSEYMAYYSSRSLWWTARLKEEWNQKITGIEIKWSRRTRVGKKFRHREKERHLYGTTRPILYSAFSRKRATKESYFLPFYLTPTHWAYARPILEHQLLRLAEHMELPLTAGFDQAIAIAVIRILPSVIYQAALRLLEASTPQAQKDAACDYLCKVKVLWAASKSYPFVIHYVEQIVDEFVASEVGRNRKAVPNLHAVMILGRLSKRPWEQLAAVFYEERLVRWVCTLVLKFPQALPQQGQPLGPTHKPQCWLWFRDEDLLAFFWKATEKSHRILVGCMWAVGQSFSITCGDFLIRLREHQKTARADRIVSVENAMREMGFAKPPPHLLAARIRNVIVLSHQRGQHAARSVAEQDYNPTFWRLFGPLLPWDHWQRVEWRRLSLDRIRMHQPHTPPFWRLHRVIDPPECQPDSSSPWAIEKPLRISGKVKE